MPIRYSIRKIPPVLYLDTQDFSRFGDVLRGVSDTQFEDIFLLLENKVKNGEVICAMSMPVLGELLQYNADYRDTTIKKAEAVERLCGSWALACPTRLIAAEIAEAASALNFLTIERDTSPLTNDGYWYPNVAEVFEDLKERLKSTFDEELAKVKLEHRWQRRKFKRAAKGINLASFLGERAPEIAEQFRLPVKSINDSIVALIQNNVTPEQASRILFSVIAKPTKFVEMYFETIEVDRSALPSWMSSLGAQLEQILIEFRAKTQPLITIRGGREIAESEFSTWPEVLGRSVLKLGQSDASEFGISLEMFDDFVNVEELFARLATPRIAGHLLVAYALQISGITSSNAKIERSFGGDLIHALYLPHVDLWRGDRRFSNLVRQHIPIYAGKVVSDRKSTRLNSSHHRLSRMPSSA